MDKKEQEIEKNIILETRNLIERGWCKGVSARNSFFRCCDTHSNEAVCWCLTGAIIRATRQEFRSIYPDYCVEGSSKYVSFYVRCFSRIHAVLSDLLTFELGESHTALCSHIQAWNDEPQRKKEHVLTLIDKTLERYYDYCNR